MKESAAPAGRGRYESASDEELTRLYAFSRSLSIPTSGTYRSAQDAIARLRKEMVARGLVAEEECDHRHLGFWSPGGSLRPTDDCGDGCT